jgi:succinoglycan biosynthesis transport protein ExoP
MPEEKSIAWHKILETGLRRRRLVLSVAAAGTLLAALWVWFARPTYRAHATILLTAKPISGPRGEAMPDRQIESELALLTSPALVRAVLQAQDGAAATHPPHTVAGGGSNPLTALYRRFHHLKAPDPFDERVRAIAKDIETNRVADTNVVEVAYRGADPKWAAGFVNGLLNQHVERIAHLNEQTNSPQFFQGQREVVSKRLQAARDALNAFRQRQGTDAVEGDDTELRKSMAELDTEKGTATTALAEARARVEYLRRELARRPSTISAEEEIRQNPAVKMLEDRLLQLDLQRTEAISKYTPTSTVVQGIDSQIAETRKLLQGREQETRTGGKTSVNPTHQALEVELVQKEAESTALAARVGGIAAQQAQVRAAMSRLIGAGPELDRLKNEEKSANDAYLDYLKKTEDARLSRALDQEGIVNISVLERAEAPDTPEPSKAGMRVLIALLASLGAGLGLALLVDRLHPAVNSGSQAELLTGVRVLENVTG